MESGVFIITWYFAPDSAKQVLVVLLSNTNLACQLRMHRQLVRFIYGSFWGVFKASEGEVETRAAVQFPQLL